MEIPEFLYHGTDAFSARRALEQGLQPRSVHKRKSNFAHTVHSNAKTVYLTDAYPLYFAFNAARKGQDAAVIQIPTSRLDQLWLVPDEDVLEQAGRNHDGISGDIKERTLHYRDRIPDYVATEGWIKSLNAMGTCGSLKPIPSNAIARVAFINPKESPVLYVNVLEAIICLANYKFCGPKYRNLTNRLFGLPLEEDPMEVDFERVQWSDDITRQRKELAEALDKDFSKVRIEEINPYERKAA
jgi:hypothetical protein